MSKTVYRLSSGGMTDRSGPSRTMAAFLCPAIRKATVQVVDQDYDAHSVGDAHSRLLNAP